METESALHFGPYQLDRINECLWRGTQVVPVRPKPFAILRYLVEHPGRLVSKAELLQAIWPVSAINEGVLKSYVYELRTVLGDDIATPQFLETVARRGYRFIAPLTTASQSVFRSPLPIQSAEMAVSPASTSPPSASLFVGRETDLHQLHGWWQQALAGHRQIVFVTGEPGIGKTTVVEAFVKQVGRPHGLWVGMGQCIEHFGVGEAYLPLLSVLGQLCREPGGTQLIELLRQHAPSWLLQLPGLLSADACEALQRRAGGTTRERMLRELAEALEVLTAGHPLVLVLEDLHWSDLATLDWLAFAARRPHPARLLVLGTYRPIEVIQREHPLKRVKQELQLHGQCQELALDLLSEKTVKDYLAARFPACPIPAAVIRILYQRTEGNPFFLVSLVEELVTQGLLVLAEAELRLTDAAAVGEAIPDTLRQMIEQQCERLRSEEQKLLAAASVAGTEFSAAAVAAALKKDVGTVEERCTTLARRQQFLQLAGVEEWPDRSRTARFRFRHALYQYVWHERVPIGHRQQIHQRIGLRKEAAYGARVSDIAPELAVHFAEGRDYPRAIRYHTQAAETAIRCHASQETIHHLTQALALLQTLPDTPNRAQQELLLQSHLRIQLGRLRGEAAPELEGVVSRIEELSLQVDEMPQLFWTLTGAYLFHVVRGALHKARALAERHLHMAQRWADPLFTMAAATELGIACFFLGDFKTARGHLERAITLYDPTSPHPFFVDWEHGPPCFSYAAFVLWFLGYPEQARQRSAQALSRVRELPLPYMRAFALNCAAMLHQLRGEGDGIQEQASSAMEVGSEHGFAGMVEMGRIFCGRALYERGRHASGISQMQHGVVAYRRQGGGDTFLAY